jgi:hypothetical protein
LFTAPANTGATISSQMRKPGELAGIKDSKKP